jgi:Zn-dependent peptidase ImmA (M78 family)
MTTREHILRGAQAAARLHRDYNIRGQGEHLLGGIDVFRAIQRTDAQLLFKPLDGLLGAYLTEPDRGILVSTRRPRSIQRFTGAHELGHLIMNHSVRFEFDGEEILSTDAEITLTGFELEANAFAGEFLLPRWLLMLHAKRQHWRQSDLSKPEIIYQLSLRVGVSYQATCMSLIRHKLVSAQDILSVSPKTLKQHLLKDHKPEDWRRDVWVITERDSGTKIEGQPQDWFIFRAQESSAGGYLWNFDRLAEENFVILEDKRENLSDSDEIGGPVVRSLVAHSEEPTSGDVTFIETRPWQSGEEPLSRLEFHYDLIGEKEGLPRVYREMLQANVASR